MMAGNIVKLIVLLLIAPVALAEDVIKESPAGGINWTRGVVFATGYGTAKESLSPAQRRILSRRAAVVDAQRNLLEITKGVRISSQVKTDEAMKESREVASRVEGIVQGATVIKDHYQNDVATVTMEMPISGDFMKTMFPLAQEGAIADAKPAYRIIVPVARAANHILDFMVPVAHAADLSIKDESEADAFRRLMTWIDANQGLDVTDQLKQAIIEYETNARFSGLLVDASSVANFELATIPRIRDESGKVIYPSDDTSYDDIVNKRGVTYDFDIQDAVRNQRVAQTPLMIKALSTYESLPSDLIITAADAAKIMQSASTVQAMNKAGVLIVVAI